MAAVEWSEKTRLGITAGIALALNLGVWYFVYRGREAWKVQDKALTALKQEVKTLQERAAQKADRERDLEKLRRENERREKKLPELNEREKFIDVLTDISQKCRMKLRGVNVDFSRPPDSPGINPANFIRDIWRTRFEGDFKAICDFINYFEEHYHRFVTIDNFNLNARDDGMNVTGVRHEVSFDVGTYRYLRGKDE